MPENQEELQSFEELFHRNYKSLCQKVFRITHDLEGSEDIVQDVFISLWKNNNLQTITAPEAYLNKACINRALNHTSSLHNKKQLHQLHYKEQQPEEDSDPQKDMEQHELEQSVQKTIEALPPMCKKVFLLSRYEEMSHKEIAAFLEISPNTVDNHIKKALNILRKVLLYLILLPIIILF